MPDFIYLFLVNLVDCNDTPTSNDNNTDDIVCVEDDVYVLLQMKFGLVHTDSCSTRNNLLPVKRMLLIITPVVIIRSVRRSLT